MDRFVPQSNADSWHTVKKPRVWHLGARVIGFVHPSGVAFWRQLSERSHWTAFARQYHGKLIKNEWNDGGGCIYPRYTVLCDDGKVRKFQSIIAE